ncbi:MAG TPA: hypothetical protein VJR23_16520 [Candidatus Acidoferrales bacterium]|nr:hypothetical protein [Candidatus Acidoferrales bacterium]
MKTGNGKMAGVVLMVIAIAIPAMAASYTYPLSSTDIRDAFMTAQRNDEQTADFFLPYSHNLPMPESGPHVAAITLETPFYQVVEKSVKAGYHSNEAEKDFLGKPLNFQVRVEIDFTATYPPAGTNLSQYIMQPVPNLWDEFKIELEQGKEVPCTSRHMYFIFSDASPNIFGLAGAIIEQDYDAEKIDADLTTVKVDTPDGQHVETAFNLAKLR